METRGNVAIVHLDAPATLATLGELAGLKRSRFRNTGHTGTIRYTLKRSTSTVFKCLERLILHNRRKEIRALSVRPIRPVRLNIRSMAGMT